jgi:hypothetical protein
MFLNTASELNQPSEAQGSMRSLGSFEELLWHMDKRSPLQAILLAHVDGPTDD